MQGVEFIVYLLFISISDTSFHSNTGFNPDSVFLFFSYTRESRVLDRPVRFC